jgi:integration host factor subunit beta
MKKSELVNRIHAQTPRLLQHQAEKVVNAILDEIVSAIARGDRVELRGFGAFTPRFAHPMSDATLKLERKCWCRRRPHRTSKRQKKMHWRLNPTPEEKPSEGAGH